MSELAHLKRQIMLMEGIVRSALVLRRAGQHCDEHAAVMERFFADNPHITRSATQAVMLEQAYETALKVFDVAVLDAADGGLDLAVDHKMKIEVIKNGAQ